MPTTRRATSGWPRLSDGGGHRRRLPGHLRKENFFVEIMDHGVPAQQRVLPDLLAIAREIGARSWPPTTATTRGARRRRATTCSSASRPARRWPTRSGSASRGGLLGEAGPEMRALFPDDEFPGRATTPCALQSAPSRGWTSGTSCCPVSPVPPEHTEASYLRVLAEAGRGAVPAILYSRRCGSGSTTSCASSRRWASGLLPYRLGPDALRREQGIRTGPGRGSAAGSIVSYALRITDLDPLRYGLISSAS